MMIPSTIHHMAGLDIEKRLAVIKTVEQLKTWLLPKPKIKELDRAETFPELIIRELIGNKIALQLVFIPEQYGGMGGGAVDACAITREMSNICLGISTSFFALQLGIQPIIVAGTESQKHKWLKPFVDGKAIFAFAVTEPETGTNIVSLQTTADPVLDDNGKIKGYSINGCKQFITNGGYADYVTLLAKTPDGPSFFIVEKDAKGFSHGKGKNKHGIRVSNTASLFFKNVYVPSDQLIGDSTGKGIAQANSVFEYTRLMVAAMAIGAGEAALGIAIDYAKKRVQNSSFLCQKQGYTHKLIVPNVVKLQAALAFVNDLAASIDSGQQDINVETSIAKYFATEIADKTASDSMQAMGGYGYIDDFLVEKIKRDIKATCIYEGPSEILQNIIGTYRWKKTRKTKGQFYENFAKEMTDIHSDINDIGAKNYASCSTILNKTIQLADKYRLVHQQYVMFNLADMMTWLEIGMALTKKVFKSQKDHDSSHINDNADSINAMKATARIFSGYVAEVITQNSMRIICGTGSLDSSIIDDFLKDISFLQLFDTYKNTISDMDIVKNMVFDVTSKAI